MSPQKKKTNLSPRMRVVATSIGLVAVAVLGYLVLISPKRAEASQLAREIETVQADIVKARTAAARPRATTVGAAELFRLAKAMPDEPDMSGLLLELTRVASDTGIVFRSITPAPVVSADTYRMLPIALEFEGNFYGLVDFLFRLRNLVALRDGDFDASGRLFAVESLSFGAGKGGFPAIKANLQVNAFVYGTDAPPAAATAAGETAPTSAEGSSAPPASGAGATP